jgi:uncharacterized RDD family membrane protein YckC
VIKRDRLAGLGRRLLAVAADWAIAQAVSIWVLGVPFGATGAKAFVPLGVFAAIYLVLVSLTGYTVGYRLVGIRLGALGRPSLSPLQVLGRTVLLCLFVPAVVWGKDGRGLHDRAAGTVLVRTGPGGAR